MTADQRFALLLAVIGVFASVVGWTWTRFVRKQDERWDSVNRLILADNADQATRPLWVERIERLEAALTKLAEVVAEQGLQQSRHEGWHERHEPTQEPLMGAPRR